MSRWCASRSVPMIVGMAEQLALRAGMLFDGSSVRRPGTVLISEGRIVDVDVSGTPPPATATVVDLGPGTCLLPGLVDAHVHLVFDASKDPIETLAAAGDAEVLEAMRAAARRMLRAGITTVRDLGDRSFLSLALRAETAERPDAGPHIVAAGPPITTLGGHCHFLGGVAVGAEALRAAVRERAERGCDVVKVMASGGNMTEGSSPYDSQYTAADLRTIVDEARRFGLPVAAHAHAPTAIADALAAGVATLEHVTFMSRDGVDADPALLSTIAAGDAFVSVTYGVMPTNFPMSPVMASRLEDMLAAQRVLYKRGAGIVVGSDAGIAPSKPHDVLPYSPTMLIDLGMSPTEALSTITSVAAQAIGLAGRKGRLGAGADADVLAVNGDPLQDVSRLRDVRAVFRAGVQVR